MIRINIKKLIIGRILSFLGWRSFVEVNFLNDLDEIHDCGLFSGDLMMFESLVIF